MSEATHIILACDESGAKGYADRDEAYPGEVGVFAGILMPTDYLDKKMPPFQALVTKYQPASGKLHIAELAVDQKEELRRDVYQAIRDSGLPCFWYAIHVAGLYKWHRQQEQIRQKTRDITAATPSRIKRGSPRSDPPSLHAELFTGLYGHLIAFLEERGREHLHIEIRSDQIDASIIKQFEEAAVQMLRTGPQVSTPTGFDTVTKTVVKGTISIQVHFPPEMMISAVVERLTFNPTGGGDGLVLAADVLANSLNHLFTHRPDEERNRPLNCPEAVASHPLAQHLDAFHNWGDGDIMGDRLYRHPKAPA